MSNGHILMLAGLIGFFVAVTGVAIVTALNALTHAVLALVAVQRGRAEQ